MSIQSLGLKDIILKLALSMVYIPLKVKREQENNTVFGNEIQDFENKVKKKEENSSLLLQFPARTSARSWHKDLFAHLMCIVQIIIS